MNKPTRIAVIGCGAIARSFHVPALARHAEIRANAILVDRLPEHARRLADEFGIDKTSRDYRTVLGDVDAAIVTVPHELHYTVTLDCLRAGKHVLCEKPLAVTGREAREMIRTAEQCGVTLAVNHTRRLFPAMRRIRDVVRSGDLGTLREITMTWGERFDWPVQSGFYFGVGGAPHGVLLDRGPHALDIICWWLGGTPQVRSVRDDSFGGGEAVVSLELAYGSCRVATHFSFLTRYANDYTLIGDSGRIEGSLSVLDAYYRILPNGERRRVKLGQGPRSLLDLPTMMIDNFIDTVRGGAAAFVPAREVLPSIDLIETCYAQRERFDMPWHEAWRRVVS